MESGSYSKAGHFRGFMVCIADEVHATQIFWLISSGNSIVKIEIKQYCASVPSKINHPSCIPTVKIILEKWLLLLFDVLKPDLRSSFVTIYVRNDLLSDSYPQTVW